MYKSNNQQIYFECMAKKQKTNNIQSIKKSYKLMTKDL